MRAVPFFQNESLEKDSLVAKRARRPLWKKE